MVLTVVTVVTVVESDFVLIRLPLCEKCAIRAKLTSTLGMSQNREQVSRSVLVGKTT